MPTKTLSVEFQDFTKEIDDEFKKGSIALFNNIQSASPTARINSQGSKLRWIKPQKIGNLSFRIANPAEYMEVLYFGRRANPATGGMTGSLQLTEGFEPVIEDWFSQFKVQLNKIKR